MSFNPFTLEGRRVLVTGASSGIGRQIAIHCAKMGATVVLTGRNAARLEETRSQLADAEHLVIVADLVEPDAIEQVAGLAGPVDGVVHAAGIAKLVPFRMISPKHLDEVLGVNLRAPLLLTRALLARRAIQPGGSIVFIGSVASEIGPVATAAYAASKAGLLGAVRALAQEVAKQRIRANVVAPGYVRTPLVEELGTAGGKMNELFDLAPLGLGEPEDVANAVGFLLSEASRWMTRTLFVVDGGFTVRLSV
jgi:NAD(P)-dependent dehydrogenase (short-subunit alcohol dehydrogenase family)